MKMWLFILVMMVAILPGNKLTAQDNPSGEWIEVNLKEGEFIETKHPYPMSPQRDKNNKDKIGEITPEYAKAIQIFFSRIELERGYDKIFLESENTKSEIDINTTDQGKNGFWSDIIKGNSVKIFLEYDYAKSYWGFQITKYRYLPNSIILAKTNAANTEKLEKLLVKLEILSAKLAEERQNLENERKAWEVAKNALETEQQKLTLQITALKNAWEVAKNSWEEERNALAKTKDDLKTLHSQLTDQIALLKSAGEAATQGWKTAQDKLTEEAGKLKQHVERTIGDWQKAQENLNSVQTKLSGTQDDLQKRSDDIKDIMKKAQDQLGNLLAGFDSTWLKKISEFTTKLQQAEDQKKSLAKQLQKVRDIPSYILQKYVELNGNINERQRGEMGNFANRFLQWLNEQE